jgi:hypothetical protein
LKRGFLQSNYSGVLSQQWKPQKDESGADESNAGENEKEKEDGMRVRGLLCLKLLNGEKPSTLYLVPGDTQNPHG